MVPRNDIVSIEADATLDEVLHTMIQQQHSRLPVYEDTPQKIIGILHYKDLLPVWEERRSPSAQASPAAPSVFAACCVLTWWCPKPSRYPKCWRSSARAARTWPWWWMSSARSRACVTVEDVLEQLVGRIEDEHDEKSVAALARRHEEVELDGATRIRDLENEFGIEIPAEAGFETLAGFLLFKFGEIPRRGQVG